MCAEHGFGEAAGLKERKAQQGCIANTAPDGHNDVGFSSDTLHRHGVDRHTDDNEIGAVRVVSPIFSTMYMDKIWAENMLSQPIFYLYQRIPVLTQEVNWLLWIAERASSCCLVHCLPFGSSTASPNFQLLLT